MLIIFQHHVELVQKTNVFTKKIAHKILIGVNVVMSIRSIRLCRKFAGIATTRHIFPTCWLGHTA